ncbi:N-acetyl-gamma-glutamyl-phosphate reductase [Erythrobacter longus]|uniref:N-acetyl-gamma-glutamyl-phosphate reductase n=1 Tax=Erythrobacter longus TaxID=1044 RepID=A0A074MXN1_ERYLO|nr:N-acetyl-gamma-glutamyl-phosphate reductase [Erythrobacter longus]KEO90382.1 N-acetyl-gamma-glutamyl-phosphate reductase [Erythrobacter longus]
MTHRIFIDGAAGTTGLEIRDRLKDREEFELIVLDDAQRKDVSARQEALYEADVAVLCLPDDAAREAVKLAEGSNTRIIDASSAHRVADGWTYGFPELIGHDKIANAKLVSNPGCYPTGFLALVAPLVQAGELPEIWPYTVNAVSGYSGGGNALIERFKANPDIAFRTYGLSLEHKHLREMQRYAGLSSAPLFSPSVVPAYRGMLVEVPVPFSEMLRFSELKDRVEATHAYDLWVELEWFFKRSDVVKVTPFAEKPAELLLRDCTDANDGMTLTVCGDQAGTQARLIARLDNLGKGASGAAIQNLNIMCGLEETTGLRL